MAFARRTILIACALALTALLGALPMQAAPAGDAKARAADIDALYDFMKATHPDLYHRTRQREMEAYVAAFRRDAAGMDWPHYVMGVYRLIRLVGDGHTAVFPFPDAGPGFDTRLPILTEAFVDGLYVVGADAAYRDAVGAKVIAVEGKRPGEIAQTLADYWPHESDLWVVRWLPAMLRRPGYLHGVGIAAGGVGRPLTFALRLKDGSQRDVAVTPMAASEDEAHQKTSWARARDDAKLAKPTPLHGTDTPFGYHYFKDRKAVYAVYRQSDDAEKETVAAFAERLFKFVAANPVDRLIIDVRENGGGDNYKNQTLLLGMVKSKVDRPGALFVLTGRQTFSAAQNFVNQAERWTQALFVGEPTGSSPNHFGDAKPITLAATKLSVIVATLRWQDSDPKDSRPSIMPDVVARDSFADYVAGRDVALDAALAYRLPADFKPTDPFKHWQRPSQWIKNGDTYTPRSEFKFDW